MNNYITFYQKLLSDLLTEVYTISPELVDIDAEGIVINREEYEVGFNFSVSHFVFDFRIRYDILLTAADNFNITIPVIDIAYFDKRTKQWNKMFTETYNGMMKSYFKIPLLQADSVFIKISESVFNDIKSQILENE